MLQQQFWLKAVHDISRYENKDQTFQAKSLYILDTPVPTSPLF